MVRTYAQLLALYGSAGTVFPDNTTGQISEADMRDFGQDLADSLLFLGDIYTVSVLSTTGTNAYAATPAIAITTYNSKRFYIKFVNASTGACTMNITGGSGAKKIFKTPTVQAGNGDIPANQICILVYDAALDSAAGGFLIIGFGSATSSSPFERWDFSAHAGAYPTDLTKIYIASDSSVLPENTWFADDGAAGWYTK